MKFTLLLVLVTLGLAGQTGAQETESNLEVDAFSVLDQVTDCDILAAHPNDPARLADGVYDDELIPVLVLEACGAALDGAEYEFEWAQYSFQYGRGLLISGSVEDAINQFTDAAVAGSAAAHGYLGDVHHYGVGVPVDIELAEKHYNLALEGGFEVAQSQIDSLNFDHTQFIAAEMFNLVFTGQSSIEKIGEDEVTRNHLFTTVETFLRECGLFLGAQGLSGLVDFRYPKGWSSELEVGKLELLKSTSLAEYDSERFIERYGCDGVIAGQFFNNLELMFSGAGGLAQTNRDDSKRDSKVSWKDLIKKR